jgi:hypothetical protein
MPRVCSPYAAPQLKLTIWHLPTLNAHQTCLAQRQSEIQEHPIAI